MNEDWIVEAAGLPLDAGSQYLLELAQRRAARLGQEMGFEHLLLAVLDRHLTMAEEIRTDIDWHQLRIDLEKSLHDGRAKFHGEFTDAIRRAGEIARAEKAEEVRVRHLVEATIEMAARLIGAGPASESKKTEAEEAEEKPKEAEPGPAEALEEAMKEYHRSARPTPFLDSVGVDLTEEARKGKLAPIVGREREISTIIEILCRHYKRNPLLIGPAGVGKTAIVEGLAQRIASGDVPEPLRGARIIQISPTGLLRDVGFSSDTEEQVQKLLREASQPGIILFIDEIHRLVGAGGIPGLHDLGQRLKPALARGQIACIGATTEAEYRQYIKDDRALERRFQPLRVDELGEEATRKILDALAAQWAEDSNVRVPPETLDEVIELTGQYMRNRRYPDKAITLLDTVLSRAEVANVTEISSSLVRETVYELVGALPEDELARRLDTLEEFLNARVLGQPEAAALAADVLRVTMRGLDIAPERPNGVLVFAGPPSMGKRTMAHAIAEHLFDAPDRVLELQMVRYQHDHSVYELIGAPPSFVGYEEGGALDWINDVGAGVIVLDNLQEAHPKVAALFEEIFDTGTITNMRGERLFFSDAIFVITCDIRTERRQLGFAVAEEDPSIEREVRKLLSDTILDRVDAVCPFYPLSPEVVRRIVSERILPSLIEQAREKGIKIAVTPEAIDFLAEHSYSTEQGMQRAVQTVQRLVMNPVLDAIGSAGEGEKAVAVELRVQNGQLVAVPQALEEGA